MARFQRRPQPEVKSDPNWRDLRDQQGKLCARIDARRMVLEIRRSDRDHVAVFDLRQYLDVMQGLEIKPNIE